MKSEIRNFLAFTVILAAVALVPATAPAYIGEDGPAPAGHHLKQMAKELQLTPSQKQQVKAIFAKNKPATGPIMKQLMAERRGLRSLIQADAVDEAAIRAQSAKVAAIQADMAVHHAQLAQEIRAVLTPEQILKAKELQARRDKKMEERAARFGKRFEQEH